jgi:signal peptidase II
MPINRQYVWLGLLAAVATLALDQASKWWLLEVTGLAARPPIEALPVFNLVMVWNTGISFGMLAGYNQPLLLIALSGVIMAILLVWLARADSRLTALALGIVLGGALGNVVDRLRFGAVADFFDFHIGPYHWPAFNIADAAIFIGVVLLCVSSMFMGPKNDSQE